MDPWGLLASPAEFLGSVFSERTCISENQSEKQLRKKPSDNLGHTHTPGKSALHIGEGGCVFL